MIFFFFLLVSIVNKSQYRDTHSEDTIGNVQNTLCLELLIASNTQ